MGTIYMHKFPNSKVYIGQTVRKAEERWGRNGRGYKDQPLLWNAIQKYGWKNIEHIIISDQIEQCYLDDIEEFFILLF